MTREEAEITEDKVQVGAVAPEGQAVPSEAAPWVPRVVEAPLVIHQVARRVDPLIVRPNRGQAKMELHSPRKRTRSMFPRCRITRWLFEGGSDR